MKMTSLLLFLVSMALAGAQPVEVAPGVVQLGNLVNEGIAESSGVDSSRRLRGVYWTHSDSGGATLYSFTTNGAVLGQWEIPDLDLRDWEDITCFAGRIYIADIGNDHGNPGDIYVVKEPNPRRSGSLRVLKRVELKYPDGPFDAESFFISRAYGYLIKKESGNAHVFRFKLSGKLAGRLEEQCELNTGSPVTGADVTSDNKRLAVITEAGAYLFALPRRVPMEGTIDPVLVVPYGLATMEGCAFSRDGLIVTAETGEILLFTDPRFRAPK
jgi:hypothetical protein